MAIDIIGGTPVYVADSATSFTRVHAGGVLISGSHGGRTAVTFALIAAARAALFNDAGVGKENAGIAGLELAEEHQVPAATVDYRSARIGVGSDTHVGIVSFCNQSAAEVGVQAGMHAARAVTLMASTPRQSALALVPGEIRAVVIRSRSPRVVCVDSASQIDVGYVGAIVATGSHGGIVDGRAVRAAVFAALFNDAGVGMDQAGIGRLASLDRDGIAGATVDCWTARIGDGLDTYENGVISYVNQAARDLDWRAGISVMRAIELLTGADGAVRMEGDL